VDTPNELRPPGEGTERNRIQRSVTITGTSTCGAIPSAETVEVAALVREDRRLVRSAPRMGEPTGPRASQRPSAAEVTKAASWRRASGASCGSLTGWRFSSASRLDGGRHPGCGSCVRTFREAVRTAALFNQSRACAGLGGTPCYRAVCRASRSQEPVYRTGVAGRGSMRPASREGDTGVWVDRVGVNLILGERSLGWVAESATGRERWPLTC
jgi:hypothetical protein